MSHAAGLAPPSQEDEASQMTQIIFSGGANVARMVFKLLQDPNRNINARDRKGRTALTAAAASGPLSLYRVHVSFHQPSGITLTPPVCLRFPALPF
jgi:hypothetical protein